MRRQQVIFHELGLREDGADWIVGRVDAGLCAALPEEGALAVRLLHSGLSAEEARSRIQRITAVSPPPGKAIAATTCFDCRIGKPIGWTWRRRALTPQADGGVGPPWIIFPNGSVGKPSSEGTFSGRLGQ